MLIGESAVSFACGCIDVDEVRHYAGADSVFVGRAGERTLERGRLVQTIEVLSVLRGEPGGAVTLSRPMDRVDECDRQFLPGEVSVVLLRDGEASLCLGNAPLATQLRDLPYYLETSGAVPTDGPTLERALAELDLPNLLRGGTSLTVQYPSLLGDVFDSGGVRIEVVKEPADIGVVLALSHDGLHLISFSMPGDRASTLLLLGTPPDIEVLGQWDWGIE